MSKAKDSTTIVKAALRIVYDEIKHYANERDMPIVDACRDLGLSPSTVSYWKHRKLGNIRMGTFLDLTMQLGLDPAEILKEACDG